MTTIEQNLSKTTEEVGTDADVTTNIEKRILDEVLAEVKRRDIKADVSKTTAVKNNENQKPGISIRFDGDHAAPIQYLEPFIDRLNNGEPINDIARDILDTAIRFRGSGQDFSDLDINVETAQNKVFLKVINKETNPAMAVKCPYIDVGPDLMAVPYWKIGSGNGETASFLVTREIAANSLHMTDSEILSIGRLNTVKSGFSIRGMSETLREMAGDLPVEMIAEMTPPGPEMMYVITNAEKMFGAAALLDPQTMEKISQKIGEENYYVLPSSIHEVLVIPESLAPAPEELSEMVRDVNKTQVSVQDRLSDNVYRVGNTMKLQICNTTQQLNEKKESAEKIGEVLSNAHRVKM